MKKFDIGNLIFLGILAYAGYYLYKKYFKGQGAGNGTNGVPGGTLHLPPDITGGGYVTV